MDTYLIIFGIAIAVLYKKVWGMAERIAALEKKLAQLTLGLHDTPSTPQTITAKAPVTAPVYNEVKEDEINWDDTPINTPIVTHDAPPISTPTPTEHSYGAVPRVKKKIATNKDGFEWNIAAKLPVWIGAISLICAGFFLVKYSIDAGLLGPMPRFIMGLLFGAGMIAAGHQIFNRPHIDNAVRMGQGLVGAGLVTLTISLYAAVHLYHLIAPFTGFCAMTAVTVSTMTLALRLGQPVAVFGLIGGFLAPALFSTGDGNFAGLYTYLTVLYIGMQTIMTRQKWHTLSLMSLIGVFLWSLISINGEGFAEYTGAFALFILTITATTLVASTRSADAGDSNTDNTLSPQAINLAAIGGSTLLLMLVGANVGYTGMNWASSCVLSLAVVGLAYFRPSTYNRAVWAKMASDFLMFALYIPHAALPEAVEVTVALLAIYTAIPTLLLARRTDNAQHWAITQVAGAIGLYLLAYFFVPSMPYTGPHDMYWALLAAVAAAAAIPEIIKWRKQGDETLVALYALAASSFISIGLAIALPAAYLPTALACEIAAIYAIRRTVGIDFLDDIAKILLGLFVALNYKIILLFGGIILGAHDLFSVVSQNSFYKEVAEESSLYKFYLPAAAALVLAHRLYRKQLRNDIMVLHAILGSALGLLLGAAYISIRYAFATTIYPAVHEPGFFERETITLIFAAVGVAFVLRGKSIQFDHLSQWGGALVIIALARNVVFDLLIDNPRFTTQHVGDMPLLNGVTLTYGAALLLTLFAKREEIGYRKLDVFPIIYKALALIFLLALTTLNVRQFFHGDNLLNGTKTNMELYSYSIVWLLTGLGLLTYGIKRADKAIRMAALAFLILTIGKVFLVDAAALEGLYRIFSFLGLGVSLIGLSMFYTRFMKTNGHNDA